MTLRLAKIALVFTVAFYTSLIALNNLFDYDSNFQYVRHVLMMDSTFPGNRGMWRALNSPMWHDLFYWTIILWEIGSAALCWWASVGDADEFQQAKSIAIAGLTVNLLLWAVAFLAVGGEWFLMWQSQTWDGEASAFRMFTIAGIVLLLLAQPEAEKENS
jgi:predicted small integral membrane protein